MTRASDEVYSLNHISDHIVSKTIGAVKRFLGSTVSVERTHRVVLSVHETRPGREEFLKNGSPLLRAAPTRSAVVVKSDCF